MNRQEGAGAVGRLALVSFVSLFYEMLVVRWLAGECRVYGYYANLPLITAFFGLGLGCLLAKRPTRLMPAFAPLLALFTALAVTPYFRRASLIGWTTEEPWAQALDASPLGVVLWYASFLFLLLLAGATFVPLGQELGRAFAAVDRPLRAYAVNLLASLAGVWGFALLCWVQRSSLPWFLVAIAGALALDRGRTRRWSALFAVATLLLVAVTAREEIWSPYYKIRASEETAVDAAGVQENVGTRLEVNNIYYQRMLDLRPATVERFPRELGQAAAYYDRPFVDFRPRSVLVVGAGSGNDVAAALRAGVESVDAVDIDPTILELGRRHHPERPYDSPAVRVTVDDARSYFRKTDRTYDLIVFALLDSHTLVSGLGRLRLDNYVYTEEALREAAALLTPDGVVYLSFTIYQPWIGTRFTAMFRRVFGERFLVGVGAYDAAGLFVGGPGVERWRNAAPEAWRVAPLLRGPEVEVPTDDWPFLYMARRSIPSEYVLMLALLLGSFWLGARSALRGGSWTWDARMFLLGAGFLLVEVRGIAALALLFGATWVVTAIVISVILAMALAGNAVAERWPRPPIALLYLLLAGALLLSYFVSSGSLLGLGATGRALLGGLLVGLPIAFAGVIFSTTLRDHPNPDAALGSNLLGAVAGGIAEYASTLTGIRALVLLALAFYLASFLAGGRRARSAPSAGGALPGATP